jgi:hypothetical protein
VIGPASHILERVLEDSATRVLWLVSPLRSTPYESNRKSTRAKVRPSRQEVAFQHRVATGVDEQVVEQPTAPSTCPRRSIDAR